jgi:dihydrofolate reductase
MSPLAPFQTVSMIVAMSQGRVIGQGSKMPWHLPADLAWFKKITMGKPIIMGRHTHDSIGKALPGRQNIIVSRNETLVVQGCDVVHSAEMAFKTTAKAPEIMIIGGALIYRLFLPYANDLYLTHIDADLQGDTFFPDYEKQAEWTLLMKEKHFPDEKNAYPYTFCKLTRCL